ncbi:MAG TPA: HD-GYP domain-containing protein [Dehalococcoidia bacterium]|nr:HD-GYP domain-containing protein [Dehalococcoidia bacterium]
MAAAPRPPASPLRIRLYVTGMVALALTLAPSSALLGARCHAVAFAEAALLALMIAAARLRPVQIGLKRTIDVGTAPEVAAVLLLPGPLVLASLVAGTVAGEHRAPLIQRAFNSAVAALRGLVALLLWTGLQRLGLGSAGVLAAALSVPLAMHLTGFVLVLSIAAVQLRENPLRRAWDLPRDTLVADLALGLTGVLTALATREQLWALPLLIAPAALAQRALRDGVALRAQTRLALEDLADIVDLRDHYTYQHSQRVAELARATAKALGLAAGEVELITMAGRVHDVGKIGIKSTVLLKPGGLTEREFAEMRSHPIVGARLIGRFPQFAGGRAYVLHHHERYDGTGYPERLAGEQIPFGARVLAVADAWDAMTSHRAYRQALPMEQVYAELARGRGTQFDPRVLDAFLRVLRERPDLAVYHTAEMQDVDGPVPATAGAQSAA